MRKPHHFGAVRAVFVVPVSVALVVIADEAFQGLIVVLGQLVTTRKRRAFKFDGGYVYNCQLEEDRKGGED